jgi:nanoRNase/pAp phosphatase (c-di-AMP/oligoRNAs hydrolase)
MGVFRFAGAFRRGRRAVRKEVAEAKRKIGKLRRALKGHERALVLMHDNPDPDSLSSAQALRILLKEALTLPSDIAFGGILGRAENRTMRNLLRIETIPMPLVDLDQYDAFLLVDTQPKTGNNSLPDSITPHAVIDHHPMRKETWRTPFHDVNRSYGACATLLTEYLTAAHVAIDRFLATALFYGIKSETQGLARGASSHDRRAYMKLLTQADMGKIAEIERAPVPRKYFTSISQALKMTTIYGNLAVASLGGVYNPDIIPEVADFLLRLDEAEWTMVMGHYDGELYLSMRTSRRDGQLEEVIKRIVGREGKAGGHGMMAGGRIGSKRLAAKGYEEEDALLRRRVLKILKLEEAEKKPLLDRE